MRKFTKEITALLAAATVGSAVSAVNAQPLTEETTEADTTACHEIIGTETTTDEYTVIARTAGVMAAETDCPTYIEHIEPEMGVMAAETDYPIDEYPSTAPATTPASTPGLIGTEWPSIYKETEPSTEAEIVTEHEIGTSWIETDVTPDTEAVDTDEYLPPIMGEVAMLDGDLDQNYTVNAEDLSKLIKVLLGNDVEYSFSAADMNNDGKVNVVDLILLKDIIMNY